MAKEQTSKGTTVAKGSEDFKESAAAVAAKQGKAVPKSNVPGTEAPAGEKKEKKLIPDIIRGRMPIAVVAMVRFGDNKNGKPKDLAKLFGTTVGKITDIQKKSTFGYLPESFKPNQKQQEEGILWLQKHVDYKTGGVDKLISELESAKLATVEEAVSYEALRIAHRGQVTTKKDGTPAAAGGGNRRVDAKKAAKAEEKTKVNAADLLK